MHSNNYNNNGRVKKTRNRKPVPAAFTLPPRGDRCCNWLPIAKREIRKRVKDLGRHRLQVVELGISNAIKQIFIHFEIADNLYNDQDIDFKLNYNEILDALIIEWDRRLLNEWKGPKLKSSTWEKKLWEGKNGYWKLCKNWADQNKYQVSDTFWCNVYRKINLFIQEIVVKIYKTNQSQSYYPFLKCLKYACLYTIFSAQIGFPKTRLLPLLVNTVIAKNGEVKKYLKKEFDPELEIYKWKEEESEKYDGINNASTDNKVCAAVKQRCIQFAEGKMEIAFDSFYKTIKPNGNMSKIDLNKYIVSIIFDAKGNITKKRMSIPKPTNRANCISHPSNTKKTRPRMNNNNRNNNNNNGYSYNNNDNNSQVYDPYAFDDHLEQDDNTNNFVHFPPSSVPPLPNPPQPPKPPKPPQPRLSSPSSYVASPPVDIPVDIPVLGAINNNVDPLYGATHGQSSSVVFDRMSPTLSLGHRQALSRAIATNAQLRKEIAECRMMMEQITRHAANNNNIANMNNRNNRNMPNRNNTPNRNNMNSMNMNHMNNMSNMNNGNNMYPINNLNEANINTRRSVRNNTININNFNRQQQRQQQQQQQQQSPSLINPSQSIQSISSTQSVPSICDSSSMSIATSITNINNNNNNFNNNSNGYNEQSPMALDSNNIFNNLNHLNNEDNFLINNTNYEQAIPSFSSSNNNNNNNNDDDMSVKQVCDNSSFISDIPSSIWSQGPNEYSDQNSVFFFNPSNDHLNDGNQSTNGYDASNFYHFHN